jgi:hypothetical protein
MKLFLVVLATVVAGAGAATAETTCDAQKVVSDLAMPVLQRAVDLAQTVATLSAQQMALQPKNAPHNEPVGKYMTKDQIERFGELRGQILTVSLSEFANSDYERDLLMTSGLLSVAQTRYEDKPMSKDDAIYATVLDDLSQAVNDDKRDYRNTDGCNFYSALASTISGLGAQLTTDHTSFSQDQATLGAMAAKYRVALKDLPNTTISPDDSLVITPIYNRIGQAVRTLQYARDLIHIEGLFQVSQIIYQSRVQSISVYGATPDTIEDELDKQISTTPDVEQQYFHVWGVINEYFPSDQVKFAAAATRETTAISSAQK